MVYGDLTILYPSPYFTYLRETISRLYYPGMAVMKAGSRVWPTCHAAVLPGLILVAVAL